MTKQIDKEAQKKFYCSEMLVLCRFSRDGGISKKLTSMADSFLVFFENIRNTQNILKVHLKLFWLEFLSKIRHKSSISKELPSRDASIIWMSFNNLERTHRYCEINNQFKP